MITIEVTFTASPAPVDQGDRGALPGQEDGCRPTAADAGQPRPAPVIIATLPFIPMTAAIARRFTAWRLPHCSWMSEPWRLGYHEWAAPEPLRSGLACLWFRAVAPEGAPPTLVLPDACVDLVWQEGLGASIAGPDTGPVPTPLRGGAVVVGARFRPGAGGPALGLPLSEIRDRRVELRDLSPGLARRLPGTLAPAEALERVAAVAAGLVSSGPPDAEVGHAAALLAHPRLRVDALPHELGLSERQLLRRFRAAVGYGPKTLQRIMRFRRFLGSIDAAHPDGELARLALDAGYADQAHLTRETSRLAGMPPAALWRARSSLRESNRSEAQERPGQRGVTVRLV